MKIRRNGLENMKRCGRVTAGRKERIRHDEKEIPLAAFSTIDLSITVIMGDIRMAALAADAQSAPNRKPKFVVFHSTSFLVSSPARVTVGIRICGTGIATAAESFLIVVGDFGLDSCSWRGCC